MAAKQRQRYIATMKPLQFRADATDISVHTVHVFGDWDGSIAQALMTGGGTVNVVLPENLAADMAARRGGSRPMWRSCRSWCLGANRN